MDKRFPTLWGNEDPPENDPAGDTPAPAPQGDEPSAPTPEPSEAERIAAAASSRAAKKARRDLAKSLGFDTVKAMEDAVKAAQEREQADASEEERRAKELADREAALAARESEARTRELSLSIRSALVSEKVNSDRLAKAEALVRMELDPADLEDNDYESAVAEAVAAFKAETKEWFGGTGASHGSNDAAGGGNPPTPESEAAEREKRIKAEFESRGMVFKS